MCSMGEFLTSSASARYAPSYPDGFSCKSVATISGEPFMHTQCSGVAPVVFVTTATVLMRCSTLEKWFLCKIFTEGFPCQVLVGATGFGTGGGCGFPAGKLAMNCARFVSASSSALSRTRSLKSSVGN